MLKWPQQGIPVSHSCIVFKIFRENCIVISKNVVCFKFRCKFPVPHPHLPLHKAPKRKGIFADLTVQIFYVESKTEYSRYETQGSWCITFLHIHSGR